MPVIRTPASGAGRACAWRYHRVRGRPRAWRRGGWWWPARLPFSLDLFQRDQERGPRPRSSGLPSARARRANRPAATPSHAAQRWRGRTVEIRAGAHGHYYASVEINGRPIDVTGRLRAPRSWRSPTMTPERAGVYIRDRDYTQRVNTANGLARIAPVVLDRVSIGDITVRNVPAAVSEPGSLSTSLLGMSFLSRLQRVDMRSGVAGVAGVAAHLRGADCASIALVAGNPRRAFGVVRSGCDNPAGDLAGGRHACFPSRAPTCSPTRPTSSACRSSSRRAFASTTRAGCYPQDINLMGLNAIGLGLATLAGTARGGPSASSSATTTAPIRPR